MKKILFICVVAMFFAVGTARISQAQSTAENLLVSTELLLISQANLAILSLNLVYTNMEQDSTTVDQDRESLQTVVDSIDLAQDTIKTLLASTDIEANDKELIRLLDKTNESLMKSTKELMGFCDDQNANHFEKFADEMQNVVNHLEKVGKLLEQ